MLQRSLAREVAAANTVLLTACTTVSAVDNKREVVGANKVKVLLTVTRQTSVMTRDTRVSTMIMGHVHVNRTCACVD